MVKIEKSKAIFMCLIGITVLLVACSLGRAFTQKTERDHSFNVAVHHQNAPQLVPTAVVNFEGMNPADQITIEKGVIHREL